MKTFPAYRLVGLALIGALNLVGCGGTSGPSGGAGGGIASTGTGGGIQSGVGGGTTNTSPQCTASTDCPYWYCECSGTSTPVNSRTCYNQQCQPAATACTSGCNGFGHSWTGRTFNSPSGAGGGGGSNSSTGVPGSACTSRLDCTAITCGCTDGASLSVRDCYNSYCNSVARGCTSACEDTNHGTWDGRYN